MSVGFGSLQMNRELGLSAAAFGFGAGIFFIGSLIVEIHSNTMLRRVGARIWISRIVISWGVVAMAMMLARGPKRFYLLRFLLGVAEAGFFPGIIFYLTYGFPARERAHAVSMFMTATQIAGVIAGPLSGVLLSIRGVWHLSGWQWLFLAEGLPAVILGVAAALYLPDGPEDARWLSPAQRKSLAIALALDRENRRTHDNHTLLNALTNGRGWPLAMLYFTIVFGHYGIALWLPQILNGVGGLSDLPVGLPWAVPFIVAALTLVIVSKHSDFNREHR